MVTMGGPLPLFALLALSALLVSVRAQAPTIPPAPPRVPSACANINALFDAIDGIASVCSDDDEGCSMQCAAAAVPLVERCGDVIQKLLPDGSDIFIAQETWTGLDSMLRIYKMYDLPYTLTGAPPPLEAAAQQLAAATIPIAVAPAPSVVLSRPSGRLNDELLSDCRRAAAVLITLARGVVARSCTRR